MNNRIEILVIQNGAFRSISPMLEPKHGFFIFSLRGYSRSCYLSLTQSHKR